MKKHVLLNWTFVLIITSIPWIYLAIIWKNLPETIPVHFGLNGTPDRFGGKNEIFFIPIVMTVISLLVFLLLTNIYKIDPKRYATKQSGTFLKFAMAIVVFISFIGLLILNWTVKQHTNSMNLMLVLMGLLFAYIGNIMHSIKPNYFAGFRLPWTLESEENWKVTHRLVSKLWFAGGILIAILALIIKPISMFFVMMGIILIMVIVPAIFSYKFFKKENAGKN